jgi:hypothetical protein
MAANFVQDWGDIWNTDSNEHKGKPVSLLFMQVTSPKAFLLVDRIAETS